MRKILFGFLGIMMVVGVVASSARALFSATGTVSAISIASGNAELFVGPSDEPSDNSWDTQLNPTGMYPGYGVNPYYVYVDMYVKNNSSADIALRVVAKMTTLPTGWGNYLTYGTQMAVNTSDNSASTGWKSLRQWRLTGFELPGEPIDQAVTNHYKVYVRIPYHYADDEIGYVGGPAAGTEVKNELSGLALSGAGFTLTGTQVVTP